MVHLGANNRARGEADMMETFGDAERTARRLFCLTPSNFDPQTHVNVPAAAGAKGHVNIYLVWEPKDDAAAVQGMCRLKRLDFAEAGP
jgi:hypothetical protein